MASHTLSKVQRMKWLLVASTLITVPIAVWYARTDSTVNLKLAVYLASLPLVAAVGIEVIEKWKVMRDTPELYQEGSPIGNRLAVILAAALILTVLAVVIYLVIVRSTWN